MFCGVSRGVFVRRSFENYASEEKTHGVVGLLLKPRPDAGTQVQYQHSYRLISEEFERIDLIHGRALFRLREVHWGRCRCMSSSVLHLLRMKLRKTELSAASALLKQVMPWGVSSLSSHP